MDIKNFLVYICAEDGIDTSSLEKQLHEVGLESKTTYIDSRTGLIKRTNGEDYSYGADYSEERDNIVRCGAYVEFVPQDGRPLMMQEVLMKRRLFWENKAIAIGDFSNGRGHAVYFQKDINRFELGVSITTRERALTEVVECIAAYYTQLKESKDVDK